MWRGDCLSCRCGSRELGLQTWAMREGAVVWCARCYAGTPSGKDEDLAQLVHHDPAGAINGAIRKWNAWVRVIQCRATK